MNCTTHPETEATGFCRDCGKALCAQCARSVQGVLYCEQCLAMRVSRPQAAATGSGSPGLAAVLGFIPGLGAVYNGEYLKALVHVAIFAGLVALVNSDQPDAYQIFYGLLLTAFIFYMPIDAYRTARAKRLGPQVLGSAAAPVAAGASGAVGAPAAGIAPGAPQSTNWFAGPAVLIGLGTILLLANLGLMRAHWLSHFWPLLLIVLGAWLLWKRLQGNS